MFMDVITTIGFTSMFGAFIYIGRKLQILDDLVKTTDKIKANLKVVSDFLIKDSKNFNRSELRDYSPIELTSNGEKFIETIGFVRIFKENQDEFFTFIDSERPKAKYDVESIAIKSLYSLYEKDFMNPLKVYFYNNPARNLPNTAQTLGIYVRNRYLAKHPEIKE